MIKTLMTKIREFVTRGVTGTALPLELETGEERGGSGEGDCHVGRSEKWGPAAD
jgi:hypothetical protein